MFVSLKRAFGVKTSSTPPRRVVDGGGGSIFGGAASSASSLLGVATAAATAISPTTPLTASLASFDTWRSQLSALSEAVSEAVSSAERLSAALLGVAEAMAPLANKAGEAPAAAAELLLASTAFASETVPNFSLALQALILRPLREILSSHAELAVRGEEHAGAVRDYEAAARDLAVLQRKRGRGGGAGGGGIGIGASAAARFGATAAANARAVTGAKSGPSGSSGSSGSASAADIRAKVVNRLVAAHALREALADGLAAELRALEGRRKAVARNLLSGVAGAVAAFGESTGSAFASCADLVEFGSGGCGDGCGGSGSGSGSGGGPPPPPHPRSNTPPHAPRRISRHGRTGRRRRDGLV